MVPEELLTSCIAAVEAGENPAQVAACHPGYTAELEPILRIVAALLGSKKLKMSGVSFVAGRRIVAVEAAQRAVHFSPEVSTAQRDLPSGLRTKSGYRDLVGADLVIPVPEQAKAHSTSPRSTSSQCTNSHSTSIVTPALPPTGTPTRRRSKIWPAIYGSVAVAAMVLLAMMVAVSNRGSLPGDPLYTLKRSAESFQRVILSTTGDEANWYADQSVRRLGEALTLEAQGDTVDPALMAESVQNTNAALMAVNDLPTSERARFLLEWRQKLAALDAQVMEKGAATETLTQTLAQTTLAETTLAVSTALDAARTPPTVLPMPPTVTEPPSAVPPTSTATETATQMAVTTETALPSQTPVAAEVEAGLTDTPVPVDVATETPLPSTTTVPPTATESAATATPTVSPTVSPVRTSTPISASGPAIILTPTWTAPPSATISSTSVPPSSAPPTSVPPTSVPPTLTPTPEPTVTLTFTPPPTATPAEPTAEPTEMPTVEPTEEATPGLTATPTQEPEEEPTVEAVTPVPTIETTPEEVGDEGENDEEDEVATPEMQPTGEITPTTEVTSTDGLDVRTTPTPDATPDEPSEGSETPDGPETSGDEETTGEDEIGEDVDASSVEDGGDQGTEEESPEDEADIAAGKQLTTTPTVETPADDEGANEEPEEGDTDAAEGEADYTPSPEEEPEATSTPTRQSYRAHSKSVTPTHTPNLTYTPTVTPTLTVTLTPTPVSLLPTVE